MKIIDHRFSHLFFVTGERRSTNDDICQSPPHLVHTYEQLVDYVGRIQHGNPDQVIFYRGQMEDHQLRRRTHITAKIYRELGRNELKTRFINLHKTSDQLIDVINANRVALDYSMPGLRMLKIHHQLRWSLLQHYEICPTPMIDITQSLHLACTFALLGNPNESGIIYLLGMPWMNQKIYHDTNEELVNIRLMSVCPPLAQRPYYQEGYVAGPYPEYKLDERNRIKYFDFSRRLIAKFKIPNNGDFWGNNNTLFQALPEQFVYPPNDPMLQILNPLRNE